MDTLSRVFKALLPGSFEFLIVGLAIGIGLLYRADRTRRLGRLWLTALAIAYLTISFQVSADALVWGLTRGFSPITSAGDASGAAAIVVLTGGSQRYTDQERGIEIVSEASAWRALEAARVYRLLSPPLVVASGAQILGRAPSDAALMADALISLGVPEERIIRERQSTNTREHALNVPPLLREHGVQRFVLVTSPTHIRRAVGAFAARGLDPVPSMSANRSRESRREERDWLPGRQHLASSQSAIYEYFGLAYYWIRGWL